MRDVTAFITEQIAKELKLKPKQVTDTIALIDDGNTIPFIARYRKEATGGIDDEVLRAFDERLKYLRQLEARKEEVIRSIAEQEKMTPELEADILKANVLQKVEDLYRPYKPKKSTRASKALDAGLEPLAKLIWNQTADESTWQSTLLSYVNEEKGFDTEELIQSGALDIIAEWISDDPDNRTLARQWVIKSSVVSSQAVDPEAESVYEMYYEYSEPFLKVANHRVLALNRGEREKFLKVKLEMPDEMIVEQLKKKLIADKGHWTASLLEWAVEDAYKRLLSPAMEREARNTLTERAEEEAIKIFGKNTQALLLAPPVQNIKVLAIDPSYRTGCKVVILDETGKLLTYTTIYPHAPQHQMDKAKAKLLELIVAYDVDIISIGNGTASRETEMMVAELINDLDRNVYYTLVSEAGASVYSASKLATEEYPDLDVSIRGAISIGRRLQDPLAELVKIDPKSIGVGQYQHDVNQKKLTLELANVVEDCVNSVGVNLNTATPSLLQHVAGISPVIAKNIVELREEMGRFKSRKEILKVKRLGPKVFEQCAGFLRIPGAKYPLDQTAVHPEAYKQTEQLLLALGYNMATLTSEGLSDLDERVKEKGGLRSLAENLQLGELTLKDIIQELKKPGRDPREDMPKPVLRSDVLQMEDLTVGMILGGTVRNVVDFGAFVDIGVKQDGLVHISELCDRFVKHPMEVVSVGDVVKVKILSVDLKRQKIALTMKNIVV